MKISSPVPTRVTRAMVHIRTHELALIAGHIPPHVSQLDYEQAKRDLTGETETDRQEAILDRTPEQNTKRFAPSASKPLPRKHLTPKTQVFASPLPLE